MTILVCLGKTPDTWWQVTNAIGNEVLSRAEALATDEEVRTAVFEGKVFQSLALYEMESSLRERVWRVIEHAARSAAEAAPADWSPQVIAHVAQLAQEMEARRLDPDRPGPWP
jgi:hypothetical protein